MINKDIVRKTLITVFFWFLVSVGTLFTLIYVTIGAALGAPPRWCRHRIWDFISRFSTWIMQICGIWKYKLTDRRKVKSNYGSYIIVANHLSMVDSGYSPCLPFDIVFMWGSKWGWTPVGWLLYLTDNIPVNSQSDESKRNALALCNDRLNNEMSIFIYPEGKRGKDPKTMLPFKTGAFRISIETRKPILPLTIFGTMDACNGWICDKATVEIIIDDPIHPGENYHDLCNHTRAVIMNNIIDRYHKQ